MKQELIFELLDRALEQELGLVIEVNNPQYLQNLISKARQGMPKYKSIICAVTDQPNILMLIKETVELETIPDGDLT